MKQHSESEIQKELDGVETPPALDAYGTYPYWNLDDRAFEILLYFIFVEDIRTGFHGEKFEQVTLMTGVGEKGRDLKLLLDGKNVGLVQGKRYQGRLGRPNTAKELIKFGLFYLRDNSLIADPDEFDYYLAVANDFAGPAIELLDDFGNQIANDEKLQEWVESVIAEYKAFEGMTFADVKAPLLAVLGRIHVRKWNATDLDERVQRYPLIATRFFSLRIVTDLAQTEHLMNKVFGAYGMRAMTDDDLKRIHERIGSIPPEHRFDFGTMQLFGFNTEILARASDSGMLRKVAGIGAQFQASLFELAMTDGVDRCRLIVLNRLAARQDVNPIAKLVVNSLVTSRFCEKFREAVQPQFLADAYRAESKVFVEPVVEVHIERHVPTFSASFDSPDHCRAVLTDDLAKLEPLIEEIDNEVSQFIPVNPTVLFTDFKFIEDEERMKQIIEGVLAAEAKLKAVTTSASEEEGKGA